MDIRKWSAIRAKENLPKLKVGQSVTYYIRNLPWKLDDYPVAVVSRTSKHRYVVLDKAVTGLRDNKSYLSHYRTIAQVDAAIRIKTRQPIYRKVVK